MTDPFRLGDIRGIYPDEIDEAFVSDFAHAFVGQFQLQRCVATGRDMRPSSESLQASLNEALTRSGIDVVDLGLCPTEVGYFASTQPEIEASIIVTASHNPAIYNGLKCVLAGGQAITADHGLFDVRNKMQSGYRHQRGNGTVRKEDIGARYLKFLSDQFDANQLRIGEVALNGLNGTASTMAGVIADTFELPVNWIRKHPGPIPESGADPTNPILVEEMNEFMRDAGYVLGVAWDGDCDRCVVFDEQGDLVPPYYLVGLLAEQSLSTTPGAGIVFDTKLRWNTLDVIQAGGGEAIPARTGHAFMKHQMQMSGASYGGELSSHHYFGAFFGCDSGMFAWLSVLQLVGQRGGLHELINERRSFFCCTPEISLKLNDIDAAIRAVRKEFSGIAIKTDDFDGYSCEMPGDWRFALTPSKTEPVLRVNFEARGDGRTLLAEGPHLFELLESFRAEDNNWLSRFKLQ